MLSQEQTQNLKTEEVTTKDHLNKAAKLMRYYNLEPFTSKDLGAMINSDDWWKSAELLTDLVKYGKADSQREAVAFLLLTQCNFRKHHNHPYCDLAVSIFSHKPFYDIDVAVEWANYRISKAVENLGRIEKVIWSVDDRNVPLQVRLRDIGFRVSEYLRDQELMVFTR